MKYILPGFLIILIGVFIYLNRSYSYFYGYFNGHFIAPPAWITNNPGSQKPKFVTLGDSLLDGVGSSGKQKTLAYLLHKGFDSEGRTDLINLAVSGATVNDVLHKQLPGALNNDPEEIILFIGVNDIHNATPLTTFEKDYREILDELTLKTRAKVILINLPYLGSEKILLPPWNFYIDLKTGQYNEVIKKLAVEKNLKLVDLYNLSGDKFKKSSPLYATDEFHPSDEGYALWARSIMLQKNAN